MKECTIKCVDVFTNRSFAGNPAGIVDGASGLSAETMQRIAGEMILNIVEFGFLFPPTTPGAARSVRYFTPQRELDISGHVTLAACHSLIEDGAIALGEETARIVLDTRMGPTPVEVRTRREGSSFVADRLMMHQPIHAFRRAPIPVDDVAAVLGIPAKEISTTGLPLTIASRGTMEWLLVPVRRKETVLAMRPDLIKLAQLNRRHELLTNHVFTLDTFDPNAVAYARHFGPAIGFWEDPATAVSTGALGAYLFEYGVTTVESMIMQQGKDPDCLAEIHVEIVRKKDWVAGVKVGGMATTSISQAIRVEGEVVTAG